MKAKKLFILIGNDMSGKTTIQKELIEKLCNISFDRLDVNRSFEITHPEIIRKYKNVSFGNRSYQEKANVYGSVEGFFEKHFNDQDIAFISSHLVVNDIEKMIEIGKSKFFNVYGVFLSNSISFEPKLNSDIAILDWNEKFIIENELKQDKMQISKQLEGIASEIVFVLSKMTNAK